MKNIWSGELIKLRAIEEHDKDTYLSIPEGSLSQKLYDELLFPSNNATIQKRFDEIIKFDGDNFFFLIEDRKGNIVGHIMTYECNNRNGTFKYGIEIKQDFVRKGYASEAIKILLNYYFNYIRYNKVTSMVYEFNGPSLILHQKLGFIKEGQLRDMIFSNGNYHDLIFFGMTKNEFNELYADNFKLVKELHE